MLLVRTLSFPTAPPHTLLGFKYPKLPEFPQKTTAAVPRADFGVPSTHSYPLMEGLGVSWEPPGPWGSLGQGRPSRPRSSASSLQLQVVGEGGGGRTRRGAPLTSQPGGSHATFRLCANRQGCAAVKILMSDMWQTFTTCPARELLSRPC